MTKGVEPLFLDMVQRILLTIALILSVLLESTFVSLPLTLIVSVLYYVLFPQLRTVVIIFLAALALDSMRVTMIGISPLIILTIIFVLNLNERLFDIRDYLYLVAVVILGSLVYSNIFSYQINVMIGGAVLGAVFVAVTVLAKKKSTPHHSLSWLDAKH